MSLSPKKINIVEKIEGITDISGVSDNRIYFSSKKVGKIIVTDFNLKPIEEIQLNLPSNKRITSRFDCYIDFPNVYLYTGNTPGIFMGDIRTQRMDFYKYPVSIFSRCVRISSGSFILRAYDTTLNKPDEVFYKWNTKSRQVIKENNISEYNGDAGFSTDGLLHFDAKTNQLLYINFYSNKLYFIDTNLNLIKVSHTIDTVSKSNLYAGESNYEGITTYTSLGPRRFINRESSISDGMLYNISQLKADNENSNNFYSGCVIDKYDLNNETAYQGSFYIPTFKGQRMLKFKVVNNQFLIAIYKSYIATYKFDFKQ
jgi:hypothetical protein